MVRQAPPERLPGERVLDLIDEIGALGSEQLILTGGEPWTHPDLLRFVSRATARMPLSVFTNGALLTDERIAALMALDGQRRERLMLIVSIDALTPEVNEITRSRTSEVLAAIARLREMGATAAFPVMLNTVLTRANVDQADALLDFAVRNGIREHRLDLGILHPPARYPADLGLASLHRVELAAALDRLCAAIDRYRGQIRLLPAEYYQRLRDYLLAGTLPPLCCGAGERLLAIDPQGRVAPCFERTAEPLGDLSAERYADVVARVTPAPQPCSHAGPRCICSFIQHPHRVG